MSILSTSLIFFLIFSFILSLAYYFSKDKILVSRCIFYFLTLIFLFNLILPFFKNEFINNIIPNLNLIILLTKIIMFLFIVIYNIVFFKMTSFWTKLASFGFLSWFLFLMSGNSYFFLQNLGLRDNIFIQFLFNFVDTLIFFSSCYFCFYNFPNKISNKNLKHT